MLVSNRDTVMSEEVDPLDVLEMECLSTVTVKTMRLVFAFSLKLSEFVAG